MGDDRLFSELERLRRAVGPQLCSYPAPCETVTASEVALLPGGLEERIGQEPRPLCVSCPGSDSRHVRHVEVVRDYRGLHGGGAGASAARMADTAHDGAKQERRIPRTTEAHVAPDPGGGLPVA